MNSHSVSAVSAAPSATIISYIKKSWRFGVTRNKYVKKWKFETFSRRNNNYLSIFISFSLSNSQNYKSVEIFYKLNLYEKNPILWLASAPSISTTYHLIFKKKPFEHFWVLYQISQKYFLKFFFYNF